MPIPERPRRHTEGIPGNKEPGEFGEILLKASRYQVPNVGKIAALLFFQRKCSKKIVVHILVKVNAHRCLIIIPIVCSPCVFVKQWLLFVRYPMEIG